MTITLQPYKPESSPTESYTWDDNPQDWNSEYDIDNETASLTFTNKNISVGRTQAPVRTLAKNGRFHGTNYKSKLNDLANIATKNQLLELIYDDDRRFIGVTGGLQPNTSGTQPNSVQYTFVFEPNISFLFGGTQRDLTESNNGSVQTYIEVINADADSGSSDITISDGNGNKVTLKSAAFTAGDSIKYRMIGLEDVGDGTKATEFGQFLVNGTNKTDRRLVTGQNTLVLNPGESASNISTTNLNNVSGKFRDGYFY